MKIKNYEVSFLSKILFELKLKGRDSRMRTRLLNQLAEYTEKTLNVERDELINSYSQKDEDGEMMLTEDKAQVVLQEDKVQEYHREFDLLMNEEFIIDESESNRNILIPTGKALLDCDLEFQGNDAVIFDNLCERFEETIERYKEESQN